MKMTPKLSLNQTFIASMGKSASGSDAIAFMKSYWLFSSIRKFENRTAIRGSTKNITFYQVHVLGKCCLSNVFGDWRTLQRCKLIEVRFLAYGDKLMEINFK